VHDFSARAIHLGTGRRVGHFVIAILRRHVEDYQKNRLALPALNLEDCVSRICKNC
jgi:hypothetical protein